MERTIEDPESYASLVDQLSGDALKVSDRTGTDNAAIAPLITDFRILMGVRLEQISGQGRPSPRNPEGRLTENREPLHRPTTGFRFPLNKGSPTPI